MSETMNLHEVPETMTLHRALWAGRIMSAFVVIALVANGTIQLSRALIASMLRETGFAMDLTRVVGPIALACAITLRHPGHRRPRHDLVTGLFGSAICALSALVSWGRRRKSFPCFWAAMTWGGLCAQSPYPNPSAAHPLNQQVSALSLKIGENACF